MLHCVFYESFPVLDVDSKLILISKRGLLETTG